MVSSIVMKKELLFFYLGNQDRGSLAIADTGNAKKNQSYCIQAEQTEHTDPCLGLRQMLV